ncbi:Bis(5'-nucleosyl)-tetraphosphatase [Wallemia ichthyophaga EXF-994]|uniref:Bis(5'-nucleosyl)-tetraphosphatase n=1 Tax=Wallemia ichthyophaga (strain EXF-994 / CBS 113033) TaxID=1299270 RepID=R9A9D6_WALI9|nr:Bis(5'-nucleosyl)-tetraphosphatase [Wallemia ichthyophaga EXF-994]EOQ98823.1 Bis(5'-nucleosyl)-tetraphosphatase [Wallemia ichthyophaga EXF-994]
MAKQLFHKFDITSQSFYRSSLSAAFVNLKPIVPGHVLVIPQRKVERFTELSPDEVSDLFLSVQRVGKVVESVWRSNALTVSVQDGVDAGQTVPHIHVHVLPRKPNDFPSSDQIYEELQKQNIQGNYEELIRNAKIKMDSDRQPRTLAEMEKEADMLSKYF